MTITLQGLIVALLTAFLIGLALGYTYLQTRWKRQSIALKESQRRIRELEQAHERQLQETRDRLRAEYEAEISATIEHYQDQLSRKTLELEQTYETRIQVLQQSAAAAPDLQPAIAENLGNRFETALQGRPYALNEASLSAPQPADAPLSQPELLRLKRQYEVKLKEAAQKLQKAYERQLAQNAKNLRADLQAEYEKRLDARLQAKDQELADLRAKMEQLRASPRDMMAADFAPSTPSQIMGVGDETTVTLSPISQRPPSPQYIQEEIEARIQVVAEQMRQDYEQQLATQMEAYQAQVTRRLEELEAEYTQRLASMSASGLAMPSAAQDRIASGNENEAATTWPDLAGTSPRENTAAPSALAGTSPRESIPESPLGSEDLPPIGLVADEGSETAALETDDNDDFGPLDLSDISQLT